MDLPQDILMPEVLEVAQLSLQANKETAWDLPMGVRRMKVQARSNVDVKLSDRQGEVVAGQAYWTIKAGQAFEVDGVATRGQTLYLAAATPVTVEIAIWRATGG